MYRALLRSRFRSLGTIQNLVNQFFHSSFFSEPVILLRLGAVLQAYWHNLSRRLLLWEGPQPLSDKSWERWREAGIFLSCVIFFLYKVVLAKAVSFSYKTVIKPNLTRILNIQARLGWAMQVLIQSFLWTGPMDLMSLVMYKNFFPKCPRKSGPKLNYCMISCHGGVM
jgi:hypothetical protein